jgi:glc operon protein GlcG
VHSGRFEFLALAVRPSTKKEALMSQKLLESAMISAGLLAISSVPVMAQASLAPPPLVSYGLSISTENAKKVAAAAIAAAQKSNLRDAVAIVDTGGFLVYFEKMQDTQTGSVDLAIEKARTSALFRRPTKVFEDGVAGGGAGLRLLRLTGAIPIEGGAPIVMDDRLVGAIGVSGGTGAQDGEVATAGAGALK